MRPSSVVYFERITFATYALGLLLIARDWGGYYAQAAVDPTKPGLSIVVGSVSIFLLFGLTLLISRRGSKIALWVLVIMTVVGTPLVILDNTIRSDAVKAMITYTQAVLQVGALCFLFTPSARAWMNRKRTVA